MKTLKYALVGALLFPATGAIAQEVDAPEMMKAHSMLQTNVDNAFRRFSIDADPTELSLAQLAEIIGVLNDPAMSSGGQSAKDSIEAILRK